MWEFVNNHADTIIRTVDKFYCLLIESAAYKFYFLIGNPNQSELLTEKLKHLCKRATVPPTEIFGTSPRLKDTPHIIILGFDIWSSTYLFPV